MPIRPERKHFYPKNWKKIVRRINALAGNCCGRAEAYQKHDTINGKPNRVADSKVVLTIAQLIQDETDCRDNKLRCWRQQYYLSDDAWHYSETARCKRRKKLTIRDLFEGECILCRS